MDAYWVGLLDKLESVTGWGALVALFLYVLSYGLVCKETDIVGKRALRREAKIFGLMALSLLVAWIILP